MHIKLHKYLFTAGKEGTLTVSKISNTFSHSLLALVNSIQP